MALKGLIIIAFCWSLTGLIWKMNRHFERSGKILLPIPIYRDRTPNFFWLVMVSNWILFAFAVVISLGSMFIVINSWPA